MIRLLTLPVLLVTALILFLLIVTSSAKGADRAAAVARIDRALTLTFGIRVAPVMRCIAHAESQYRYDPWAAVTARSRTNDYGLLQVHVPAGHAGRWTSRTRYFTIPQLRTLAGNLAAAKDLYRHGGLAHWTATLGGCG